VAGEDIERRLAAIMSADVAGYSRLMGTDEAGTLSALKALRREVFAPQVAAHKGRVVKLMGDGALVEFPSIVNAVNCAIAVQRALADRATDETIRLRIGINLGDIIIEGSDIYGDGVNVAARIQEVAEPGGVALSGPAFDQVSGKVEANFADDGEHEFKNIAKSVRVWRWTNNVGAATDLAEPLPLPDKPSIAVLPFDNMSSDAEQEYFADGIAEDIITALSRVERFFVTARNSSFTYKGRAVDVQQVGRELGVRYILEGSVRRSGQRLRVTAQLIDATTGKHVWAEHYDRELSDIFDVQDEITRNVVATTQTQIQLIEGSLFEEMEKLSLPVWVLVNRSWKQMYELNDQSLQEAISLAEEAVSLDPGSGRAHQALASALFHWIWMGFATDVGTAFARALRMAERAVRLDKNNEYSHWTLGLLRLLNGEHDKATAELERAIEINPNCSLAYGTLATVLNFAGYPEKAIANNEIAIRSNPRDPSIFFRYSGLALSYFLTKKYEAAIELARKAVHLKPEWHVGHAVLVASLVESGQLDDARLAVEDYVNQSPKASIGEIAELPFRVSAHREQLVTALRKAGLPA